MKGNVRRGNATAKSPGRAPGSAGGGGRAGPKALQEKAGGEEAKSSGTKSVEGSLRATRLARTSPP